MVSSSSTTPVSRWRRATATSFSLSESQRVLGSELGLRVLCARSRVVWENQSRNQAKEDGDAALDDEEPAPRFQPALPVETELDAGGDETRERAREVGSGVQL
jgi:hypothetical protein